jgi:cytochrome c biogenesis protein CcdA
MTPMVAVGAALWLGVLTAISPCPLASNLAAVSFIGRQLGRRGAVLLAGLLYTLGRAAAYAALGSLLAGGLLAAAGLSLFLQKYMNLLLGPVLILVGMVLLGWLGGAASLSLAGDRVQAQVRRGGVGWAFPLGVLFALSFCPVSAGLFFGALVPLAVRQGSRLLLPAAFGVGTALPVLAFALLIAFAAERVGRAFDRVSRFEAWVRRAAAVLFVLAGLYYSLTRVYGAGAPR